MVSRKATTDASAPSTDVALPEFAEADLRALSTLDDVAELFRRYSVEVRNAADEVGDGFAFIENKDRLVGVPMILIKWDCNLSTSYKDENGNPLRNVQVWVMYERGGQVHKVRFVDFSSGVCRQLWDYSGRTGRHMGLAVANGLRKSEFEYEDPATGKTAMASTYYLDIEA